MAHRSHATRTVVLKGRPYVATRAGADSALISNRRLRRAPALAAWLPLLPPGPLLLLLPMHANG